MEGITWLAAGLTDCGLTRRENQDNFFVSADQRLLVVADGMGGEHGGATASKVAVETLKQLWEECRPEDEFDKWLSESIKKANASVGEAAAASKTAKSMGTTMVAALQTLDGRMFIAHVGDSRAYLVRNGKTELLTNDHSVVWEMHLKGQLTYEQCKDNPWRHLITRCLGHDATIEVDCTTVHLERGDWIILATDGLSSCVDDRQIETWIGDLSDPEMVCKKLVDVTLEAGAPDNVTIIATSYCPHSSDAPVRQMSAIENGV